MRTLLSIALLLSSLAQAQLLDDDRVPPLLRRATTSYTWFAAAPSSGVGITGACGCDAVTAVDGTALSNVRGSTAICNKKGLATTGIVAGDYVTCAINTVRVQPNRNGVLGPYQEGPGTNYILQSETLDNGSWSVANGGSPAPGNPTITANQATSPRDTLTAERIQFPAVSGTGYSVVYNTIGRTSTAATWTHSMAVMGASGSGTIYLMSVNATATVFNSVACNYVAGSWSICSVTGTETAATWYTQIGVDLRDGAQSAKSAQDVYVYGVQGEESPFRTSYIVTTSASASRSMDNPYFAKTFAPTAGFCVAATVEVPSTNAFQASSGLYAPGLSTLSSTMSAPYFWPYTAFAGGGLAIDSLGVLSAGATGYSPALDNPTTSSRYVAGHNGTAWFYCVDAVCQTSGSGSTFYTPSFSYIKLFVNTAVKSAAIWTDIQVDFDWTRCTR